MNDRFLRIDEVIHKTGLARSTIYHLINKKEFPSSIPITRNIVGWLESEINQWIQYKIEQCQNKEN